MEILRIFREEHHLIKYYVPKHLILLRTKYMMDINVDFHEWFINILIKSLKIALQEYSLVISKHNQILISKLENQNIYDGFIKKLIIRVSLSRTHLPLKIRNIYSICFVNEF